MPKDNDQLDELAADLTGDIDSMYGDIQELGQVMDTRLGAMGTTLDERMAELTQSLDTRLGALEKQIDRLSDSVNMLTWAICESAGLWLPAGMNAEGITPSQAAQVLAQRKAELKQQGRVPGALETMMEENKDGK